MNMPGFAETPYPAGDDNNIAYKRDRREDRVVSPVKNKQRVVCRAAAKSNGCVQKRRDEEKNRQ